MADERNTRPVTVVSWLWGSGSYRHKFTAQHANALEAMVRHHYDGDIRFVTITDDPRGITGETFPLWDDCNNLVNASGAQLPSCYRRLRLFDREINKHFGDRICSIDLDTVITGNLNDILDRTEPFVGWHQKGQNHDRVYNGSLWIFDAEKYQFMWDDFDPKKSPQIAHNAGYNGSDQSWISYKLAGKEAAWTEADGVHSWPREVRHRKDKSLPEGAKVIMFHGSNKPWDKKARDESPWMKNWWGDVRRDDPAFVTFADGVAPERINALAAQVAEHYPLPHRFVAISREPVHGLNVETAHDLITLPDAYRRLQFFTGMAADQLGERVIYIDHNAEIVASITSLVEGNATFACWRSEHFRPTGSIGAYDLSMFMIQPRAHRDIVKAFSVELADKRLKGERLEQTDQAWAWLRIRSTRHASWTRSHGLRMYAQCKDGLRPGARVVFFGMGYTRAMGEAHARNNPNHWMNHGQVEGTAAA